ncbi:flavin reductase family protein, partial [Nitrolancea hollandica]|uniref:flavin reductase family protein n=1 Tax=Nitrolancea hollandica TaxID=1206749 RepID=UPI001EE653C5
AMLMRLAPNPESSYHRTMPRSGYGRIVEACKEGYVNGSDLQLDAGAKRKVLRWFTYGLYAVTAASDGEVSGFTANWLSQASFDPPLVMVSVERDAHTLGLIRASGRFAVNVLASGQRELAGHFGKKTEKVGNKLATTPYHLSETGLPVLDTGLGYVVCQVTDEVEAGDSVILVGRIIEAGVVQEGQPLTMAEAGFRHAG